MPSATIVHAAVFAAGALLGGGVATALNAKKREVLAAAVPVPVPVTTQQQQPIIEVRSTGETKLAAPGTLIGLESAVLKYGNPGPVSDQLIRKAYVAGYDRRLRHPAWTAEHLTLASLGKSALQPGPSPREAGDRQNSQFAEDASIPALFRAKLQDYFRSGYDRGHMVPAADAKISQDAMDETFLLTNIAPQVGVGFNRHYWAYLEDWCRRLTSSFADVYVFTIPLYLPKQDPDGKWRITHEVIGNPPNIAVPTHFAKVVLTSKPASPSNPNVQEIATGAFVLPNAPIPDETKLESFVVPVEAVEKASGLSLFSDIVKSSSKHICQSTKCELIVRRFDDAQKRPEMKRALSAPR